MFRMIIGLGADTWEVRRGGLWKPQEAWRGEERLQLVFFCRGESEEFGLVGKQRAEKVSK